jgi:nicotinate-nucleotide adenylyltransferase
MQSFDKRFASAAKVKGSNPKVKISDIESRLGTRFTIDTLKRLKQKYPRTKFYFLMGADNLIQLTKWKKWYEIFKYAEIHVFDRDELAYPAIKSRAAVINNIHYHRISLCRQSSTQIRNLHKD